MKTKLIEIYLFIDPLGRRCNNARKTINKFRKDHIKNVRLRVIPIVNAKKVLAHARKNRLENLHSIVDKNNRLSKNTYQACLAFHASTMQGKRAGYEFLSELQLAVVENKQPFSEELVFGIAKDMNILDLEMFMEDYDSDLAKNIYHRNLKLAAEMNIEKTPSCVIIKNGVESEAIRVDKEIENELLHQICGLDKVDVATDSPKYHSKEKKIINNILEFHPLSNQMDSSQ